MDARIKSAHDAEITARASVFSYSTVKQPRLCARALRRASQRSAARVLVSAPGEPSSRIAIPGSLEGSGAPAGAGACEAPGGRTAPVGRLPKLPFLRCEAEERAFRRSTAAFCDKDGPRFRERGPATPVSQLLAPGPNARERSPAIARGPGVRCSKSAAPHQSTAGFPRLADPARRGHISGPFPAAAPSSRRPMTTPLEEQDKRLYAHIARTGQ